MPLRAVGQQSEAQVAIRLHHRHDTNLQLPGDFQLRTMARFAGLCPRLPEAPRPHFGHKALVRIG